MNIFLVIFVSLKKGILFLLFFNKEYMKIYLGMICLNDSVISLKFV